MTQARYSEQTRICAAGTTLATPTLPDQALLPNAALGLGPLLVTAPIEVVITRDETGQYQAAASAVYWFGRGATADDAYHAFLHQCSLYYFFLSALRQQMGVIGARDYIWLCDHLAPAPTTSAAENAAEASHEAEAA